MKKMLAVILAAVMMCSGSTAMAAHKHRGQTHQNGGRCTVCHKIYYAHALNESFAPYNARYHWSYCSCGYRVRQAHSWKIRWKSATQIGYRCAACGARKTVNRK